jgi:RNA polymerase sigma factor (sigma-70 family)
MSEFDQVYAAYRPRVERLAHRLTRGVRGRAYDEEVAAAGLVALWRAHSSYDPARGTTFWQHARKTVWGTMVDEIRSQSSLSREAYRAVRDGAVTDGLARSMLYPRSLEDALHVQAPGDPEEDACRAEEALTVRRAFGLLRGNERRVVCEHYFEDRNLLDVGEELGVSESRASQLKKSALETMRAVLSGEEVGDLRGGRLAATGRGRKPRLLTARGRTQSLTEWAREVGLRPGVIWGRMNHGWTAEEAISTPVAPRSNHGTSVRGSETRGPETRGPETRVQGARVPDARVPDARVPDARVPDARVPDARVPDARGGKLSPLARRALDLARQVLLHADESDALRADLAQVLREAEEEGGGHDRQL